MKSHLNIPTKELMAVHLPDETQSPADGRSFCIIGAPLILLAPTSGRSAGIRRRCVGSLLENADRSSEDCLESG
jgi:hypothetical protein